MEKLLNKLLADLVVEYHKLQSYHWYLKGYHFFDDHPKLESYYDMIAGMVDGVAEDMLKLSLKPESTMKGFLALTSVEEAATTSPALSWTTTSKASTRKSGCCVRY